MTAADATLRALLASPVSAVLHVDDAGRIVAGSPAARAVLGEDAELVGRTPADVLAGAGPDVRVRTSALDDGWLVEVSTQAGAGAAPEGTVDEQVAMVAHDLRAPTRRLLLFVQLLRGELGTPRTAVAEAIDHVEQTAEELLDVTAELIDHIGIGRGVAIHHTVDLASVVADALEALGPLVAETGGTVEVADDLPSVRASHPLLVVAVHHLLDNALRWTRPGVAPRVVVDATREGMHVVLRVSDNGPGIPPDARERVFEPFARLQARTGRHAGLGLSSVRRIATLLGGSVAVDGSSTGAGSLLSLRLLGDS